MLADSWLILGCEVAFCLKFCHVYWSEPILPDDYMVTKAVSEVTLIPHRIRIRDYSFQGYHCPGPKEGSYLALAEGG